MDAHESENILKMVDLRTKQETNLESDLLGDTSPLPLSPPLPEPSVNQIKLF